MSARLFRLSASLLGVSVLLLLLGSVLLSAAPARSGQVLVSAPARSGIVTDTRWIELIRSGGPGSQLNQSASALPTLNLHLIDNLIAGRASSPALITLVVERNHTIILNTSATPYPDGTSYFYAAQFCPLYIGLGGGGGGCSTLQTGDIISLTQGGASLTMTVPTLTASVDAQADRVFGSAPVSGVVTTYLYPFADTAGPYTQTVSVDANGYYQADYAEHAGRASARQRLCGLQRNAGANDLRPLCGAVFARSAGWPGNIGVGGAAQSVVITVANANGTPYFYWSAYAAPDGSFESYSYSYWGLKLKPGDRITATSAGQVFSMTVLTITTHIDLVNHLIWGDASANQTVEALRFDGPLCCASNAFWNDLPAEQTAVTATATGQYTAPLGAGSSELRCGDRHHVQRQPNLRALCCAILVRPDGQHLLVLLDAL